MLQNAYFVAKIGADTAENEQHFAEILPSDALWRRAVDGAPRADGSGVPRALSYLSSARAAFSKNAFFENAFFENFANFIKFQNFQLENLVDFEKCCKTHI